MALTSYAQARMTACLENVVQNGAATVTTTQLKMWWKAQRITKTIWRDIVALWAEIIDECKFDDIYLRDVPLFVADNTEWQGSYTFIWGEGLKSTDKSWFKNLNDWT